jgi:hypothetical protein
MSVSGGDSSEFVRHDSRFAEQPTYKVQATERFALNVRCSSEFCRFGIPTARDKY